MIDHSMRSASRAAGRVLEELEEELRQLTMDAARTGNLHGSYYYLKAAEICRKGYRRLCESTSIRVAEIHGAAAKDDAAPLAPLLEQMAGQVLGLYPLPGTGRSAKAIEAFANSSLAKLSDTLPLEREAVLDDLRLGIAGGLNVAKRQSISIDNRGGAAQIAVDSAGAVQTVHGDLKSGIANDLQSLRDIVRQLRQEAEQSRAPADAAEEVADLVVSTERELQGPKPEVGRVRRLMTTAAKKAGDFGLPIARATLEAYLKKWGLIP